MVVLAVVAGGGAGRHAGWRLGGNSPVLSLCRSCGSVCGNLARKWSSTQLPWTRGYVPWILNLFPLCAAVD